MERVTISTQGGEIRIDRHDSLPRIRFSPTRGDTNAEAAERRAAAIFGPVDICDPWTSTLPSPDQAVAMDFSAATGVVHKFPPPTPFQIVPSEFLRRAQQRPPQQPEATASAFAQWLYSLYASAVGSDEDRESGLAAEPEILAFRRRAFSLVDHDYLRQRHLEWELVHCGLHLNADPVVSYFTIDDLRVHGHALRASPDLVYRHKSTGEVIVVEIKLSRMAIPSNLWPNVWGSALVLRPVARGARGEPGDRSGRSMGGAMGAFSWAW